MRCTTKYCKGIAKPLYCYACQYKRKIAANPMRVSYQNLKGHAKSRRIEFSLTFDEFKEFCYETDYMIGKGNTKNSYTIDRRFSIYGYHWWNIQVMTRSDNSSKGNRDIKILQYDYITDTAKVYRKKPNTETNNPF